MCSVKKGVLENFVKFTEKRLCQSLFLDKMQAQAYKFIKKGPLVQGFPVDFAKFSGTLNTSGRVLQAIPEPFFMAACV